jgi:CBS domain-containing protein
LASSAAGVAHARRRDSLLAYQEEEGAMTIRALLATRDGAVIGCSEDETVGAVVARLVDKRIGAVPVLRGDAVIGIFSERDVIRCVAEHGPVSVDLKVATVMTSPAVTVEPDSGIMDALSLMTRRRFRHLPVVEGEKLVGFISIGDLVKYRIDQVEAEAAALRDYIST